MKLSLFIAITLTTVACTTTPVPNTSSWQDFGYEGMAEKINRISGPSAINCGIRNHIDPSDPVNSLATPAQSRACIKSAIESKTPFRYGSIRIPTDSYLFEALVLSETLEYWIIKYDYMIDESGHSHHIQRCKSVTVDYDNLSYTGNECHDVSDTDWFSDIRAE